MPNGAPNWWKDEYPKLEQFFLKIANILNRFAELHNLKTNKYYHQFPSWDLQFRHPKGGVGQIEIGRSKSDDLDIFISWWKDDFEQNIRYIKSPKKQTISTTMLTQDFLENLFREVLSWDESDLQAYPSGSDWSKHTTKEKFDAQINEYPFPKL